MFHLFSFEKLLAWQEARNLVKKAYLLTGTFPPEEKFGLVLQIRRAATSVCANIAEGSCRSTAKDQAYFTTIAFGSLIELLNHLIIAHDIGFMSQDELLALRSLIQPLSVK